MSRMKIAGTRSAALSKRATPLLIIGALLLIAQPSGQAQTAAPLGRSLQFYKNYFLPGADYVVGGVGLRGQGVNGLATGQITISGAPEPDQPGDIAAAYLYWSTIEPNDTPPMAETAYFRGVAVSGKDIGPGVRVPGCWGSGGGGGATSATTQQRVYRADILKDFPTSTAEATFGKLLVNGTHEVKVSDSGGGGTQSPSSGNQVNYAEGAGIVVVYRVPGVPGTPFRAVVIHDGVATTDQDFQTFDLNVGGYYDAAATPNAKVTTLVADGGSRPENLTINGFLVPDANPFRGTSGTAWDNPTFDFSTQLPAESRSISDDGIPIQLRFPSPSIDCLSWVAVVARVDVQDGDGDALPDRLEDAATPLVEPPSREFPAGLVQPNYFAIGARSHIPDVFVELGYLRTDGWGNGSSVGAHDHRPTAEAVEMVARAFKGAGINAHFDVGNAEADFDNRYPAGQSPFSKACATWSLACAIVPDAHARGGEFMAERGCLPDLDPEEPCRFALQQGVIGWKSGYNYYRDVWVDAATGAELTAAQELACSTSGGCPRRRFDDIRRDFWHYSLWAHALGLPKNPDPAHPDYQITGTHSGFGDLGGGDQVITLHGFGFNYNAAPVTQAGTFLHELAHNFGLRHSGRDPLPNCETNYVSALNYMFQVHGIPMVDAQGLQVLGVDLSHQVLNPLNESSLNDGALTVQGGGAPMYGTRWYAPAATSFVHSGLGLSAATKHCNGSPVVATDPQMVRVDGTISRLANGTVQVAPVDWLADGDLTDTAITQDINFNGGPVVPSNVNLPSDSPFSGFNDWEYVRQFGLREVGSRPNMGLLSVDVLTSDLGRGDPGRGDPGRGDPGRGDPGRGDPGRGDPGRGDPGRGDPGRGDPGAPGEGDLDIDAATGHAHGPHMLRAAKVARNVVRLSWLRSFVRPQGVFVDTSTVYRVDGTAITLDNFAKRRLIGVAPGTLEFLDDARPANGKPVVYIVFEDWSDGTRTAYATVGFTYQ